MTIRARHEDCPHCPHCGRPFTADCTSDGDVCDWSCFMAGQVSM